MDPRITRVLTDCTTRPGASPASLRHLVRFFGQPLPRDYLELLSFTNGFDGPLGPDWVCLWTAEYILDSGRYLSMPHLVFIGLGLFAGGYAYDFRFTPPPIVTIHLGPRPDSPRILARSVAEFLTALHDAPPPPWNVSWGSDNGQHGKIVDH